MPSLGSYTDVYAHPHVHARTHTDTHRKNRGVVPGVSLLKGSGNFHSRVLLKLPQATFTYSLHTPVPSYLYPYIYKHTP